MNKKSELQKTMFGSTLWNIWIWLTIVLVVLADVNVVVSLGIEGVGGWHLVIPIVFLALDVILALVAAFSNFRFRYSLVFPIIYAAFTVVIGIVGIVVYCAVLDYIVFTSFALISWMIFELLSVATILLSTIRASGKGLVFSIITVVLVVIFAAYSIFYVVIVAQDGFFGQGKSGSYSSEERTTTYRYDEDTDTYIATGTLSGRGGTVLISDSVNGKKVGEVDCSIFLGAGITSARLLCDGDVKFSNTECIADLPDDFTVTASSDSIDGFKTYFYELSVETAEGDIATYDARTDALRDAYADFANRITPEVENGEVYIVFTYGYGDLQTLGVGNVLPTWISEKSDTFSVSDLLYGVEDTFMYENMDPSKEANLYYYYTNYGKIILNELCDSLGNPIEGQSITSSMSVGVSYEDIYAVSISTNDTVYEGTEEFSEISDFSSSGFRYVTGSSANDLISNINNTADERAGFTYKWAYGDGKTLGSLENVIEDGMEISLEWTLDAPEISMISSASATYGDDITLATTSVSHGDEKIAYTYSWTKGDESVGTSEKLALSRVEPTRDSGTYTLTVYASASDTSLTSSASKSVSLTVSKKTLSFEWKLDGTAIENLTDEELTYSGVDKTLSSTVTGVLEDETEFSYTQSTKIVKDAQYYSFYATLNDDWGEYYAMDDTYSGSFTISPYELTISWVNVDDLALTYDGEDHDDDITYTLTGFDGDDLGDSKAITQGGATATAHDAGSYLATVSITNGNYTLSNPTLNFSVAKATLTVASWAEEIFTYDGEVHVQQVAEFNGRVGEDNLGESYAIGGDNTAGVNAGSYTSTVSVSNANYNLTGENLTQNYSIGKATLTVVNWATETFTYDGTVHVQKVAAFDGRVGQDDLGESYEIGGDNGEGINAGSYTSTVSISNGNYELTGENLTESFTIGQATLTVTSWAEETFTYDGTVHVQKVAEFEGRVGSDVLGESYAIGGADTVGINAGNYTSTVSISNTNYNLIGENLTQDYSISPASLSVTWTYTTTVYDGAAQHPVIASYGALYGDDTITFTYTDGNKDVGDSYEVTATSDNPNYTIASGSVGTYSITPAPLTVTEWTYITTVYSGAAQHPIVSTFSGNIGSDEITFSYTAGYTDVGNYSVTATSENPNYEIVSGGTGTYSITPASLTITAWTYDTTVYNGTIQHPEISTFSGNIGSDVITFSYTAGYTDVGTGYTVTATSENPNYEIVSGGTGTYSITPAPLTITSWDDTSLVYNASLQYPKVAVFSGICGNDDVQATYEVTSGNGTDAGGHTVTVTIDNNNYNLTVDATCTYTISPITVEVKWDDDDKELKYSGESQHPYATFGNVLTGESVGSVEYTIAITEAGDDNSTVVGKYTVTVSSVSNGNYALPEDGLSFEYSIIPMEITVSWNGLNFTYDGTNHYTDVTYSATGAGDAELGLSVEIKNSNNEVVEDITNADSYIATVKIADSSVAANYTITNSEQIVTVAKATLTVSWDDATKEFTYNGTAQQPKATITGICGSDTEEAVIAYSVSGTNVKDGKSIDAGSYTVTISLIDTANYELEGSNHSLEYTISPAPLSATWTGADSEYSYDGSAKLPTVSYGDSTIYESDTVNLYPVDEKGDSVTGYTNAGTYIVYAKSDNPNYEVTSGNSCTFTIAPVSLTVTWVATSFTYTGSDIELTCTANGVSSEAIGLTVTITDSEGNEVAQLIDAGTYTATVSITDATARNNYTITNSTQTITVAKASVSVTWTNGTPSFTWSQGSIDAETAGITCTYYVQTDGETWTGTSDITEAGTYYAVLSIADDGNYEFASGAVTEQTFTVSGD